jgi:hypothetical protein
LTLERQYSRDAWIFNLGAIFPGKFDQTEFEPPDLPFININWLHRFKNWTKTRSFVQAILAEHPYRELVDSELSELEFQLTVGFKWQTSAGIIGLGNTENILNFDNTPDIGFHLTWGILK